MAKATTDKNVFDEQPGMGLLFSTITASQNCKRWTECLQFSFKDSRQNRQYYVGYVVLLVSPTGKTSTGRVLLPFKFRVAVDAA